MITTALATVTIALGVVTAPPAAGLPGDAACAPVAANGVRVVVDKHFSDVTLERFLDTYFAESFNDGVAPRMAIRSRALVEERRAPDGSRLRRTRMRPEVAVPAPLLTFGSADELVYDEIVAFDAVRNEARFVIESAACRQVKYGGTMRFTREGDGVRFRIDAILDVDAPLGLGALVEGLVQGGVRDGYTTFATYLQRYLDARKPAPVETTVASVAGERPPVAMGERTR